MSKTLTCVYCGMAYPEGTPPHGAKILTDHIRVCEKHPMRLAEEKILKLRSALFGLVGAVSDSDLDSMEIVFRSLPAPESDKIAAINAITVLRDTA